nr:immunoglobulin heavy chain junction region [Macaca mulatta]
CARARPDWGGTTIDAFDFW